MHPEGPLGGLAKTATEKPRRHTARAAEAGHAVGRQHRDSVPGTSRYIKADCPPWLRRGGSSIEPSCQTGASRGSDGRADVARPHQIGCRQERRPAREARGARRQVGGAGGPTMQSGVSPLYRGIPGEESEVLQTRRRRRRRPESARARRRAAPARRARVGGRAPTRHAPGERLPRGLPWGAARSALPPGAQPRPPDIADVGDREGA
ncbi:unnamed protein product [Prorocentrum cordatum]|uniref:Uncharacterized protein n=1 Tax=Prorocentrum cordatum TaxID=2364126 RepID=A0ABN9WQZ8_9DINO|nr:unnamed protein product [Polarella glacialis]